MKKLCYVTTIALSARAFLLPVFRYIREHTDWELTVICDEDVALAAELPEGVRYIPVSMKRGVSLGGIAACMQMAKIFRKEKFDLVQFSTPNAALYASIAARLAGVKIRLYHQMGLRYLGFTGLKRWIFKSLEKICCSLATEIECVSPSNLELGIQEGLFPAGKAKLAFYGSSVGVDVERFTAERKEQWRGQVRQELGINEQACVFGFAGRITGDKGINELLTAFLDMDMPHTRLLMVGVLEEEHTLDAALLERAEQTGRLVLHGFVNDIERYYAAMDVLILPSYREGFGNIVIEAQAMGIPVIVADIPGPTDAMQRDVTGLVVPVKDAAALRKAMEALASDADRREAMGAAGLAFVKERFDQTRVIQWILEERTKQLGE